MDNTCYIFFADFFYIATVKLLQSLRLGEIFLLRLFSRILVFASLPRTVKSASGRRV